MKIADFPNILQSDWLRARKHGSQGDDLPLSGSSQPIRFQLERFTRTLGDLPLFHFLSFPNKKTKQTVRKHQETDNKQKYIWSWIE